MAHAGNVEGLLPPGWVTPGTRVERVHSGRGGADVFRLCGPGRNEYAKMATGPLGAALRDEARKLEWLYAHGAPVARLLDMIEGDDVVAYRAEALPGAPATQADLAPELVVRAVGHALRRLHALPTAVWPFGSADAARLAEARTNLRRRLLKWPVLSRRKLARLETAHPGAGRPPVIVHGDADLANVIVPASGPAAFIDCGAAGLADPYLDLYEASFAVEARFGEEAVGAFFTAYGVAARDHAALAHYRALDDFF